MAILAFVLLANCSSKGESAAPASADMGTRSFNLTDGIECEPSLGLLACLRRNEPPAAKQHEVDISRSDGPLCMAAPGASEVCLPHAQGLQHVFLERSHGYFVVVEIEHIEGYAVLLVDEKTGSHHRIDNRPLFSPAKDVFATVSYDTDAGYLPNRVAIWNSSGSELLYEVDRFATGTGPILIGWLGPTRLQVRYSRTPYSAEPAANTGNFRVWKDAKGAWHDDYTR
ncbi:MAG: hypothetical protein H0W24_07730 [Lysobacter sp.]|nr:hypothetical protein [Lysobacter sp.]